MKKFDINLKLQNAYAEIRKANNEIFEFLKEKMGNSYEDSEFKCKNETDVMDFPFEYLFRNKAKSIQICFDIGFNWEENKANYFAFKTSYETCPTGFQAKTSTTKISSKQ